MRAMLDDLTAQQGLAAAGRAGPLTGASSARLRLRRAAEGTAETVQAAAAP